MHGKATTFLRMPYDHELTAPLVILNADETARLVCQPEADDLTPATRGLRLCYEFCTTDALGHASWQPGYIAEPLKGQVVGLLRVLIGEVIALRAVAVQQRRLLEDSLTCPHGNDPAACDACDLAGDLAYDSAREARG